VPVEVLVEVLLVEVLDVMLDKAREA